MLALEWFASWMGWAGTFPVCDPESCHSTALGLGWHFVGCEMLPVAACCTKQRGFLFDGLAGGNDRAARQSDRQGKDAKTTDMMGLSLHCICTARHGSRVEQLNQ